MRLRRVEEVGELLDRMSHDAAVARTGLAERDVRPSDLMSPFAFLWSIEAGDDSAGLIWLDTCEVHYACLECTLLLERRGHGIGPVALLGVVLYAFDLLPVSTVCFAAKEYNQPVIRMCERVGLAVQSRHPHPDEFDPSGSSELVEFLVDRTAVRTNTDLCRRLLRRPVVFLDLAGEVHYVATSDLLSRREPSGPDLASGGS